MSAKFIKASNEYTNKHISVPAPYIRKGFTLDFVPEHAKITVASSGFYELYINGENITKGYLAPYISNPDHFICSDEYDISKKLKKGGNAIGIILGNGFANQTVTSWSFDKATFRAPLCVSVELVAEGENGEKYILNSDESFKTHPSHITYDMYRYGTHVDARFKVNGWSSAEFDDYSWQNALIAELPKGEVVPCLASPIVKIGELKPIRITEQRDICYLKTKLHKGEDIETTKISGYLYDFGRNAAGVTRLKIKGERGQTVKIRHCEHLGDDGSFNVNSIYTLKPDFNDYIDLYATDVYTLSGEGEEIFIPSFTYHGFRYAFVEGITPQQATEDLLTFEVIASGIEKRADFTCSNERINTLYRMGINADISNFHYFPTDCPHREKNGWTGDISVSAEQLLNYFRCSSDLGFWLKSLMCSQRENGSLPGIAPTSGWGFDWGNGPMWDSAAVTVPYYIYKYDGNTDVLHQCSDMIYRYLKYVASRRDDRGLVAIGLGDWCQPRAEGEPISAPLALTDSITVFDIAKKSEFVYSVIGDSQRQDFARTLAAQMRIAIREHLIDFGTMTALGSCQTSQALLISCGILNEDEIPLAYRRLIELTHEKDDHLYCGMIGLRYIFDVLADGGDIDLAIEMICRPDEPSYGSMIERGATSLCESLMENGLNESENHHFLGDIIRIFMTRIAGMRINPDMSDPDSFVFSPTIPSDLDFAEGRYSFTHGEAIFGWRRNEGRVIAYISVPNAVAGRFTYGEQSLDLTPGYHEILI